LRVSSRGDSFTLEPNSPSDVVRRRLRVAMYIEGSVEIAGDAIRVTVQLINSADGFHIHREHSITRSKTSFRFVMK
jgi:TolB-like protein